MRQDEKLAPRNFTRVERKGQFVVLDVGDVADGQEATVTLTLEETAQLILLLRDAIRSK